MTRPALLLVLLAALVESAAAENAGKGLRILDERAEPEIPTSFASFGKYALLIGINHYDLEKEGIPALRYAVTDARAFYDTLVDSSRGDFPAENVTLLTDDTEEAPTSANIGRALNRVAKQATKDDLVLIFFSGHGLEDAGRSYLLPKNADLDALDYTAIERDAFIRQIDQIPAGKVVVILDACHAGGISRGGKAAGAETALTTKYYEKFVSSQGRAFIASCSGGQSSWEDESSHHGVFTEYLIEALSGPADTSPRDGIVTLAELRAYLDSHVTAWARQNGKSQQPQATLESAFGDIPLSLNLGFLQAEATATRERALRAEADSLRAGLLAIHDLEPVELAHAAGLLDKMERGAPLDDTEVEQLRFVDKLAKGDIDLRMYRAALRPTYVGLAPGLPTVESPWRFSANAGVVRLHGDGIRVTTTLAPSVTAAYVKGRWLFQGRYQYLSGDFVNTTPGKKTFSAHLMSAGPGFVLLSTHRVAWTVSAAYGGLVGSDIRNDRFNYAVQAGTGIQCGIGSGLELALEVIQLRTHAMLTPPTQPALENGTFAGLGLTFLR